MPQLCHIRYPLVNLYGANLPSLQAMKAVVDPEDVVGFTGGFKL